MKIFILEDSTARINFFKNIFKQHKIYIARTYIQAIFYLTFYKFDLIQLDHDIIGKKTGYDVAKFIYRKKISTPVKIHSMNIVGADRINRLLKGSIIEPFNVLLSRS